jgi:hypothetical protein
MHKVCLLLVSAGALLAAPALSLADPVAAGNNTTSTLPPAATVTAPPGAQNSMTPAPAMAAAPAPANQTASSDVDLDRIVCKSGAPPTGSRLGATRSCKSVRDWNAQEKDSQDTLTRMQSTGYQSGGK